MRLRSTVCVGAVIALTAVTLASCKSSSSKSSTSSAPTKTLVIGTDLPLQGDNGDQSKSTNDLIQLYLDQIGNKVGNYKIELKAYDDSTAAKGKWDDATCSANATAHISNTNEVAVMGTFNSGCAKIEVPVLDGDPQGPMLIVSHANTNVGLTKKWSTGEPDKYYPKGTRNYARVVTTDDNQGNADALFAKQDLKVTKCYVYNDNDTYGKGVASSFVTGAKAAGIQVVGEAAWDKSQPSFAALFQDAKSKGADCIFLGGTADPAGAQLIKDKVDVLGDNTKVKLLAPDGFSGVPNVDSLAQAEGMYVSFAGIGTEALVKQGGVPAQLIEAYKKKYGKDPVGSYPLYGVAAVQVILAAIEKSDGTRKSVTDQVLSGSGITVAADKSATGKEIKIDPKTGDTSALDISVLKVTGGKEVFQKAQSVS